MLISLRGIPVTVVLAEKIGLVQQTMILVVVGATFFQLFSPVPAIGCNPPILNWDQEDAVVGS